MGYDEKGKLISWKPNNSKRPTSTERAGSLMEIPPFALREIDYRAKRVYDTQARSDDCGHPPSVSLPQSSHGKETGRGGTSVREAMTTLNSNLSEYVAIQPTELDNSWQLLHLHMIIRSVG